MKKLDNIKGIIFDYGGTLDTRGDHWSEVIWKAYLRYGIGVRDEKEAPGWHQIAIGKSAFREAYVYGERALAVNPIVTPDMSFLDVLKEKISLQLAFLSNRELLPTGKDDAERQKALPYPLLMEDDTLAKKADWMSKFIYEETYELLQENKQVLEHLRQVGYPMVLVSNFYGNINQVLKDAGIDGYFQQVIESAVVGVRKPNPAIFALGVCALDLPASQVLVVGDTYGKDIVPAHKLGCHTLWIKGLQWEEKPVDETVPDGIIRKLSEMEDYLNL